MSFKTDYPQIFPDFVTPKNFLLFFIYREYVDLLPNEEISPEFDEESKSRFHCSLFEVMKDSSIDLFAFVKENENPVKKKLNFLVRKRLESTMGSLIELKKFTDADDVVRNVLSSQHDRVDVAGTETRGHVCENSIIGIFLKKFCLAIKAMPIEKLVNFADGFRELLENREIIGKQNPQLSDTSEKLKQKSLVLKQDRLSRDQMRWQLESINDKTENILFESNVSGNSDGVRKCDSIEETRAKLDKAKRMYPDLSESFFLDNLLAINNRDFRWIECDVQMKYPAVFLSEETQDSDLGISSTGGNTSQQQKKAMLMKNFRFRQRLSEISLNCAVMLSSMGFKNEALMHYKDAIFNAKLSNKRDLIAEVGSVGNSLMPINDNPNGTFYSMIDNTVNDKAALGSIRDFFLQGLHNNRASLAELLHQYFCSPAPQRREITSICLVYLSIVFRSFGFESMANTYLVIAGSLESIKRTKNHREVLVEVFSQMIAAYSVSGQFDKAFSLYKSIKSFGDGILMPSVQLQTSIQQMYFNHCLMRFNFAKAYACLEKLKQISLPEYGIRKVQMLFMEESDDAGIKLGNHIVSFAVRKRELLVYNHVSISKGYETISSQIPNHKSSGIIDNSDETAVSIELPTLDDSSSSNWGSRDWAVYECRCRWLMCVHLINRHQLDTAYIHLTALSALASKFMFYQFKRLCQILHLAIDSSEQLLSHSSISSLSHQFQSLSPLSASSNLARSRSVLSSRLGLSPRTHMLFTSLLVNICVAQRPSAPIPSLERHMTECREYCERCGDWMGQAHCWRVAYSYYEAVGNDEEKSRALFELELLLENRLTNIPNLDFLSHILWT